MIRLLLFIILFLIIDFYAFQGIKFITRNSTQTTQNVVFYAYWGITALCILILIVANMGQTSQWPQAIRTYIFASIFILIFSKLVFVLFILMDDLFRVIKYSWNYVSQYLNTSETERINNTITRSDFLVRTGLIIGSIPFFSLIYGMVKGAYDYQIRKVLISSGKISNALKGLRIVHISDMHLGSFNSIDPLKTAIDLIQKQKPDLILFTGDLVNNTSAECEAFINVLKEIKAPYGTYSVLGNHDYGDYVRWSSETEKQENLNKLIQIQRDSGWQVLMDQHTEIPINGAILNIVGVQNWSAQGRFKRYGSLDKADQSLNPDYYTILLSHDPSHWKEEVIKKYNHIDLTLSGHTHGFQFGIEIPGFKWSPVQYVYKEWAGLYELGKQKLYVNRGLGFLGYPGRVGILPEITLIELSPETAS